MPKKKEARICDCTDGFASCGEQLTIEINIAPVTREERKKVNDEIEKTLTRMGYKVSSVPLM